MIQTLTPTFPDRLDDYRRQDILSRATLGPLRAVAHDASPQDKARALQDAQEGFHRTLRRYPSLLEENS